MGRSIDVDVLLGEDKLNLTLDGKTYEINDIGLDVFLAASKNEGADENILHTQLATALKVDKSELKGLGIRATSFALKAIRDWITETSFAEDKETGDEASGNP